MQVPQRIEISDGDVVVFTWEDGSETRWSAVELREACQCAACREPQGREQTALVVGGPVPVTITDARLVGGYAITFDFAPDGHGTGIYSFDALAAGPATG